jgi:hypothetical protein
VHILKIPLRTLDRSESTERISLWRSETQRVNLEFIMHHRLTIGMAVLKAVGPLTFQSQLVWLKMTEERRKPEKTWADDHKGRAVAAGSDSRRESVQIRSRGML